MSAQEITIFGAHGLYIGLRLITLLACWVLTLTSLGVLLGTSWSRLGFTTRLTRTIEWSVLWRHRCQADRAAAAAASLAPTLPVGGQHVGPSVVRHRSSLVSPPTSEHLWPQYSGHRTEDLLELRSPGSRFDQLPDRSPVMVTGQVTGQIDYTWWPQLHPRDMKPCVIYLTSFWLPHLSTLLVLQATLARHSGVLLLVVVALSVEINSTANYLFWIGHCRRTNVSRAIKRC